MLEPIIFVIGVFFGCIRYMRSTRSFIQALIVIWALDFIFTNSYRIAFIDPSESFLTRGEIWATILWPALSVFLVGYILGEVVMAIYVLISGKALAQGPTKLSRFFNSFQLNLFKMNQFNVGKDSQLQSAIDVSAWLYLDKCKSRKRLAMAIGREYDLSVDDEISLFLELNQKRKRRRGKLPIRPFLKRNDGNTQSHEKFYEKVVKVGAYSGVELNAVKSHLKTLADTLNIGLARAEKIVQNSLEAVENARARTNSKKKSRAQPDPEQRKRRTEQQYRTQNKRRQTKSSIAPETIGPLAENLAVLGLRPGAKIKDVKAAYRRRAKKIHPDSLHAKNISGEARKRAELKMVKLNAAYAWLLENLG